MLKEKFFIFLLLVSIAKSIPRPDDSDESKDDDDDICSLPAVEPGKISCLAAFARWTFNSNTKTCEPITYGGCRGTKNLFETESACNAKCNRNALLRGASGSSLPSLCNLPLAAGNCRAIISSFYYDSASGTCKSFRYTGCKGNANNFITIGDCEKTCRAEKATAVTLPAPLQAEVKEAKQKGNDDCNLPPIKNTGRQCLAFIPSWTFDSKSGKCVSYVYGGCGKTANLYKTEAECQAKCGPSARSVQLTTSRDSCLLPVEQGPCFAYNKRYAFKKDKNRCEMFVYGGCRGNANSFATADECFQTCGGELPSLTPECEQVSCPVSNKQYLEKGCRPVYKGKACCPTSFSCPDEKSPKGVCHYGGMTYALGQKITAISEDHPCKTDCYCVSSAEHQGGATIKCSEMECPVTHASTSKDCQVVTKPNKCCPSVECDDNSSEEKDPKTCIFQGNEYNNGQSIPTGDPCKVCTCVEGFTGLNGPGCRETRCLVENRVGCVPIYTENVCCPTSYKCAKSGEQNKMSRIIRVDGEPGKQGAATLPFMFPGGDYRKWQVKSSLCLLPKEIGPCKMSAPSFYYDADQSKCLPFLYGGCRGNENRFTTEEQCLSTCQYSDAEIAAKEASQAGQSETSQQGPFITTGIASTLPARVPAKGQDQQSPFINTGVASTLPARVPVENQEPKSPFINTGVASTLPARVPAQDQEPRSPFITSGAAVTLPARVSSSDRPSRCLQPKLIGPCRMALEKFYFDTEQQDCRLFFYGGCKGNSNQFQTVEECQKTCNAISSVSRSAQTEKVETNVCELPQDSGPCRGQVPSYFYNSNSGACESFWYGGCRGNGNRFETEVECQSRCVSNPSVAIETSATTVPSDSIPAHCNLAADTGKCRASHSRFHYNATAGQCQLFTYGGCRGNENNFKTIEQCQAECSADVKQRPSLVRPVKEEKDVTCKLPADSGFCRAFQERFFYDSADNQCKTFSWGGCLGNANNFATLEDCSAACGVKHEVARSSRARARLGEPEMNENEIFVTVEPVCSFGNETLYLGDRIQSEDPCEECVCSTPPEITCIQHTCPPPPPMGDAICRQSAVAGQCCPEYSCVSANPPFIDVCDGVVCKTGEHCEQTPQESADGSWMPPIGLCVADTTTQ